MQTYDQDLDSLSRMLQKKGDYKGRRERHNGSITFKPSWASERRMKVESHRIAVMRRTQVQVKMKGIRLS